MISLEESRKKINEIDREMAELFDRRMQIVLDVAAFKQAKGSPVFDPEREKQVIRRVQEAYPHRSLEFREALGSLFQTMMDLSKEEQVRALSAGKPISTAYYGVPGSFTQVAMERFFGEETESRNYLTCREIFRAVADGTVQYGVVPIENSTTGIIQDVYDALSEFPVYIVREGVVEITQNLLGTQDATLEDVREVYSHAQGFAQSEAFFTKHSGWNLIPYFNTAKAAEHVAEMGDPSKACVASRKAAGIYGLKVLAEGIQDAGENYTRFIAISRLMETRPENNRISLYLRLEHKPGSLYRALEAFARNGINLLKLQSRPVPDRIWEYGFYADLEGNANDEAVIRALREVRPMCLEWKLLGNYPGR